MDIGDQRARRGKDLVVAPDKTCASILPAIRAVRAELDRRGLKDVAISAPDSFNLTIAGCEPEDPAIAAFALHHYGGDAPEAILFFYKN
jgi:hypothetical protein